MDKAFQGSIVVIVSSVVSVLGSPVFLFTASAFVSVRHRKLSDDFRILKLHMVHLSSSPFSISLIEISDHSSFLMFQHKFTYNKSKLIPLTCPSYPNESYKTSTLHIFRTNSSIMAKKYFQLFLGDRVVQLSELDDSFLCVLVMVIMGMVFLC